jgi:hypothetical protein
MGDIDERFLKKNDKSIFSKSQIPTYSNFERPLKRFDIQ